MSGPQKSGVIVYSNNIKRLSDFYTGMFNLTLLRETDDFISVGDSDFNIVIHTPPIEIPEHHFNTVKIFLTVESLEEARGRVEKLGGEALAGEWSNPVFSVCNISDPDGNHIQIREFKL
ncbi:VOC family protein [Arsukibacterium sp.]|uniref:VOC family protein n=1 Tax=Arsukibacterium sp. TaxID=1977258 RepID=UPI00299D5FD6|nr:VOC family protein [Arsukibacterium sp.]MDX1536541.1 VOC family protein [Arsukibacterium sp.]